MYPDDKFKTPERREELDGEEARQERRDARRAARRQRRRENRARVQELRRQANREAREEARAERVKRKVAYFANGAANKWPGTNAATTIPVMFEANKFGMLY